MNHSAIEVSNITVAFREIPVLWDVSFNIPEGKMIAIVGPNGAGKSTLMKTMLNLIRPNRGVVKIDSIPIEKIKKRHEVFAYVPQRESVDWDFPINCLDVVMMGRYGHLGLFRRPGRKEKKLAKEALAKFGMEGYEDRQINELSGGQKQRVFLARAYVQESKFFFLDEPFEGVDAKTEEITLGLLQELRDSGHTILVVTHDLQSLRKYFDMVLLLNTRLIAFGSPQEVLSLENLTEAYGGVLHIAGGGSR